MSFPKRYVDEIFSRLTVRYGHAFLDQWKDMDVDAVKADWSSVLDGWEKFPDEIAWALQNLPEKQVNAAQFRALLRLAPSKQAPMLSEPPADKARVEAILVQTKAIGPKKAASDFGSAAAVVRGIRERAEKNGISRTQIDFLKTCMTMLDDGNSDVVMLRAMSPALRQIAYP